MQLNFDNRGGIRRMYAIPAEDILRIRNNWSLGNVTPELKSRSRIVEIPFYAGQKYNFREEHTITEDGDRYKINITGLMPSQFVDARTIDILRHGEWLVLHQDTRGRIRLSGSKQIPLRFFSVSDTGSAPNELNGETFTFDATENETSPECYIADMGKL